MGVFFLLLVEFCRLSKAGISATMRRWPNPDLGQRSDLHGDLDLLSAEDHLAVFEGASVGVQNLILQQQQRLAGKNVQQGCLGWLGCHGLQSFHRLGTVQAICLTQHSAQLLTAQVIPVNAGAVGLGQVGDVDAQRFPLQNTQAADHIETDPGRESTGVSSDPRFPGRGRSAGW